MSTQNTETQNTNIQNTNIMWIPELGPVVARAAVAALVIGSALTAINQPDAVFGDAALRMFPLGVVFTTPLLVVCLSQVLGFRAARRALAGNGDQPHKESFFQTMVNHGIPRRSVLLGLGAGGANTVLTGAVTLLSGHGLDQLPLTLVLQALILSMIFGALSQALSFRREYENPAPIGSVKEQPSTLETFGGRLSALEDALYDDPADEMRRRVGALEARVNSR